MTFMFNRPNSLELNPIEIFQSNLKQYLSKKFFSQKVIHNKEFKIYKEIEIFIKNYDTALLKKYIDFTVQ